MYYCVNHDNKAKIYNMMLVEMWIYCLEKRCFRKKESVKSKKKTIL